MNRRTLAYISPLLFSLSISAQAAEPGSAGDGDEADHQELRAMKAVYEKAVAENNLDLLKPMIRDDFSFVTFTDTEFDRKRDDFETFKSDWTATRNKLLQGGSYTVELQPERSLILGNIAIARGDSRNILMRGDGREFTFTAKWTAVCIKENGAWKVIRAHNSLNPFENPLLHDIVRTLLLKTGTISGLGGAILGVLLTLLVNRIRRGSSLRGLPPHA